jgi:hypothetical protein
MQVFFHYNESKLIVPNQKKPERKFLVTYLFNFIFVGCSFFLGQCQRNHELPRTVPVFDSIPSTKTLNPLVNEISGIADSKANPGYLWGQEDSGNPPQLYLINHDGLVSKKIYLAGIANRDWEDITLFNDDIYIAETGDNAQAYASYRFYKLHEPSGVTDTVSNIETINFTYPDGSHDAEAFLIDASTRNIYIITKRDSPSKIYRLGYPYSATNNAVILVGTLPYTGVVSAASLGNEIIIKTYTSLYYYKRAQNESTEQCLQKPYTVLPYAMEPQGEAVSFATNGSGFYTISEKGFASMVNLYFYKRN